MSNLFILIIVIKILDSATFELGLSDVFTQPLHEIDTLGKLIKIKPENFTFHKLQES